MRHNSSTSTFSVRNVFQTTALLASITLAASAQTPPPTNPPANAPANPNQTPGLGGPPVAPGAADSETGFAGGKLGAKKGRGTSGAMIDERTKGMLWMRTFEQFKTTLSEDVRTKTEAIQSAFQASMKTWNDANEEKMKALREQMKGQKDNKAGKAIGEQMKALRDTMPKMEETQKQIFGLMSESEQAAFKTKLEASEKQMKSLRANRDEDEMGSGADGKGKDGKGKGGKVGPGGKPGDGQPPAGGDSDKAPPPPPFDP